MNPEDLLGLPVKHRQFDGGIITRIEDGHMYVQFTKEFKFPDALTEEYLTIADAELRTIVLEQLPDLVVEEPPTVQPQPQVSPVRQEDVREETIHRIERPGYHYSDWVREFPQHVVLMKELFMYNGHYESAEVISRILNYQMYFDNFHRPTAGGPDEARIARRLEEFHVSYIIVEHGEIIDGIHARDAFDYFGIPIEYPQ